MAATMMDQILDALDTAQQRATYGAVAAVVGVSPRALMAGRERNQRHSWVVNLKTGFPTDYAADLVHPALTTNAIVLKTMEELVEWLDARGVQVRDARAA